MDTPVSELPESAIKGKFVLTYTNQDWRSVSDYVSGRHGDWRPSNSQNNEPPQCCRLPWRHDHVDVKKYMFPLHLLWHPVRRRFCHNRTCSARRIICPPSKPTGYRFASSLVNYLFFVLKSDLIQDETHETGFMCIALPAVLNLKKMVRVTLVAGDGVSVKTHPDKNQDEKDSKPRIKLTVLRRPPGNCTTTIHATFGQRSSKKVKDTKKNLSFEHYCKWYSEVWRIH